MIGMISHRCINNWYFIINNRWQRNRRAWSRAMRLMFIWASQMILMGLHALSFLSQHMSGIVISPCHHVTLARYVKLRVAHAPGMPGTFSPPPRIGDPDMHHGTCWDRLLAIFLEVDGGENVSGILGACAARNIMYLAGGPWWKHILTSCSIEICNPTKAPSSHSRVVAIPQALILNITIVWQHYRHCSGINFQT